MADLSICPECASDLVQPLGWDDGVDGRIELELRCPECFASIRGDFSALDVESYEQDLRFARHAISGGYEQLVRENMATLADCFERALALDLVGPDDFADPIRVTRSP